MAAMLPIVAPTPKRKVPVVVIMSLVPWPDSADMAWFQLLTAFWREVLLLAKSPV